MLIRERWPHGGGIDVLAEKVGCDWGTIAGIIDQDNPGVSFDLADKLISTGLGRWDIWHGALADIYPTKFMETCALPGCGKTFPEYHRGPFRKRYCSKKHQRASRWSCHHRVRRCRKGLHKMTPENTYILRNNGREYKQCRACKLEYQRTRYHTSPRAREMMRKNLRAYRARKAAACK